MSTIDLSNRGLYNEAYIPIIPCRDETIILYGGRDSAKSYTAAQLVLIRMLQELYCKVICLRKIYADIKDSQFSALLKVVDSWGLQSRFKHTTSPLAMNTPGRKSTLIARGLDREAKTKSIDDPTILWIEEANEITEDDYLTAITSLRSSVPGALIQTIITFNPENESNWINRRFFPDKETYEAVEGDFHFVQSTQPNTTILHTTYKDNRYVGENRRRIYENLKNSPDRNYYRVWCLGLWGNTLKGLVFPDVEFVNEFPPETEWDESGYGLDYGFTNDPTSLVKGVIVGQDIYLQDLIYACGLVNTGKASPSIETEFKKLGISKRARICADGSEPKSCKELRNLGYAVKSATKGKGSVEAGISGLRQYNIHIVGDSPGLKLEQSNYKYAIDRNGDPTNKPIDKYNHAWDAARYFLSGIADKKVYALDFAHFDTED